MNATKKLAKKNAQRRQLEPAEVFIQMLKSGKSAKEIAEALGITERQASKLIFRIKQQITKMDDCSAFVSLNLYERKRRETV